MHRILQASAAACLLPFIADCTIIDPGFRHPDWAYLTGLLAYGAVSFLVTSWHSDRLVSTVTQAVNRAAADVLAGSEMERLLQDTPPPPSRASGRGRMTPPPFTRRHAGGLADQPRRAAPGPRGWLVDGQQQRLGLVR